MICKRSVVAITVLLLGSGAAFSYEVANIDLGRGPVNLFIPEHDPATATLSLVMVLHGRGATGDGLENFLQFEPLVDEYGFVYLHPDGMVDQDNLRFWNATPTCCDFYNSGIDDSGYLRSLIDEIKRFYPIDPARVFIIGHSNGGFMAFRMACDHAGVVTGIVSLAGATFLDPADCHATAPVHVLHVHGSNDQGLLYEGGCFDIGGGCYPGGLATVTMWAEHNQCSTGPDASLPPLDISDLYPGAETTITRFHAGCDPGGSAELWTVNGAGHTPYYNTTFGHAVMDLLLELTQKSPEPRTAEGRAGH